MPRLARYLSRADARPGIVARLRWELGPQGRGDSGAARAGDLSMVGSYCGEFAELSGAFVGGLLVSGGLLATVLTNALDIGRYYILAHSRLS